MSQELTLLKNITDLVQQKNILAKLVPDASNIILKNRFQRTLPVKFHSVGENNILQCVTAALGDLQIESNESLTATFMINNDKYMFETQLNKNSDFLNLTIKRFYHIQKRQTNRFDLKNVDVTFTLKYINNRQLNLDCKMQDISSLGCAITTTDVLLNPKADDIVQANVLFSGETNISLHGIIKNVRQVDNEYFIGLEFHHMMYAQEETLSEIIARLQKRG